MKRLRGLLYAVTLCLAFGCTLSANTTKTEGGEESSSTSEVNAQAEEEIKHLTKADFLSLVFNYEKNPDKWVYEGKLPCIVDFYADWCGPCRMVAPILKELAGEYKGKIVVYKINVDKEKELASVFGVQSIPTFLFIPQSDKPTMGQGAMDKESFKKAIDTILLKKQ